MKLAYMQVSDRTLNEIIEKSEDRHVKELGSAWTLRSELIISMALELRRRRDEDRQREQKNP